MAYISESFGIERSKFYRWHKDSKIPYPDLPEYLRDIEPAKLPAMPAKVAKVAKPVLVSTLLSSYCCACPSNTS
jgi:hypothetical protein